MFGAKFAFFRRMRDGNAQRVADTSSRHPHTVPELRADPPGEPAVASPGYEGDDIPALSFSVGLMLMGLRDHILADEYSVIIGDDTSGRVPTLMIAKTVNAYRRRHGKAALPVVFIEGGDGIDERQRAVFDARFALHSIDTAKRGLVVTENVGWGFSVGSILRRLEEHGMAGDVATYGGLSQEELNRLSGPVWPASARAVTGDGDPRDLIDSENLSGLRNGMDKFAPGKVIRDGRPARSARLARRDIQRAVPGLLRMLE